MYDYPKKSAPTPEAYWGTLGTKHISLFVKDGEFEKIREYLKSKIVIFTVEHKWDERYISRKGRCKAIFILDMNGTPIDIREAFTPEKY